ncbi:MAG: hypothetical protein HOI33_11340 [Rhodospirillaceae bacterium]|nr:hypothetical protein [Rhodospirillaceae bacterium]
MINGLVPSEGTVITSLSINGERMLKGWIEETVDFPDWLGGPAFKTATIEVTGHNRNEGCPASVEIHGEELLGSDEGPTLSLVR